MEKQETGRSQRSRKGRVFAAIAAAVVIASALTIIAHTASASEEPVPPAFASTSGAAFIGSQADESDADPTAQPHPSPEPTPAAASAEGDGPATPWLYGQPPAGLATV